MITEDTIEAFNNRQTVNLNNIKQMTPAQLDRVKIWGLQAEALLKNRDLALFIHQFKFELCDQLAEIQIYTDEADNKRIAISNQLAGIDKFIASLKTAVYYKNRIVTQQNGSTEPNDL
jgi:hypothetical protein